jgi:hypothetical protein
MRFFPALSAVAIAALSLAQGALADPLLFPTALPQPAVGRLWITGPNSTFDCGAGTGTQSCFRDATFANIPGVPPDVVFTTNLIGFSSYGNPNNSGDPFQYFTVGSFLDSLYSTPATYSGSANAFFGSPVTQDTPLLSCQNNTCAWLTFMELTGNMMLNPGDEVLIAHDDGVSLMLNGILQPGFNDFNAPGGTEAITYHGPAGLVSFDLVYAESHSAPAYLQLATASNTLLCPEPASAAILGVALPLYLTWRRKRRAAQASAATE